VKFESQNQPHDKILQNMKGILTKFCESSSAKLIIQRNFEKHEKYFRKFWQHHFGKYHETFVNFIFRENTKNTFRDHPTQELHMYSRVQLFGQFLRKFMCRIV